MYVMELEADLLKRVLKYWNLKHEDFPLLQDRDSLSEIMSGYWYEDTLYYDCLKKVGNPKLLVSEKAFKAFVERFIERLNTILIQVVTDIRKELTDSESKQCKILTEKMMICSKDAYALTDADSWTLAQLASHLELVQQWTTTTLCISARRGYAFDIKVDLLRGKSVRVSADQRS